MFEVKIRETELKEAEIAAINWANEIRKEEGKKPLKRLPPGKRSTVTMCPLAKATGKNIMGGSKGALWSTIPNKVRKFILWFDQGRYKDLIEPKKKVNEPF